MTAYSYEQILDDVLTVEDLHLVSAELDMLNVNLFKSDQEAFKTAITTKLHRNLSDSLTQSLTRQNIALDNHDGLQHYFTGLKQFLTHLPVLQLTLAYQPNNEQIEKLCEWARRQTGKPVILQLHYNPQMLGGAVVTFEGRYTDLSLKKKLDTTYETKREEVLRMLG